MTGGMLAAGAVLTPGKIVAFGELWGGNPARLLREISAGEREGMVLNVQRYVALAKYYRSEHPAIYKKGIAI